MYGKEIGGLEKRKKRKIKQKEVMTGSIIIMYMFNKHIIHPKSTAFEVVSVCESFYNIPVKRSLSCSSSSSWQQR